MKKLFVFWVVVAVVASVPAAAQDVMTIINDRVGIGEENPSADIHLANVDATGSTVFKFDNAGTSWNFGLTGTGVLTYNKAGSGGQEATFRERNHSIATLDVQGHVRGTSFKSTSSRALKTGFDAIDSAQVLAQVAELPLTSWRYKTEDEGVRHIGPMAEDFQSLFGLGDGETIATVDADGIALVAIQGLYRELRSKDTEIESLRSELQELRALIEAQ